MALHTFPKEERIRKRAEFHRVFSRGEKYQTPHFRVIVCPNTLLYPRLGVTVGKKIGSAVLRNRVKRRVREFFRLNKGCLPASCDLVITAREGAAGLNFSQVSEELKGFLRGL